jgi:Dehydrogenases with different specificities (related to short-chain alcohol dehydrogenases)
MKKTALITGGTKGIGKSVAVSLAGKGYDLILTYSSDPSVAQKTVEELQNVSSTAKIHLLQADSTSADAISCIGKFLTENDIILDTVIFNAGVTCRDTFEQISLPDWERVFFANVHFPVFLLQSIVDRLEKGGSVVFTGSLMGIEPHSVSLAYGVSKSAVHALVKNLVKFLVPYHIRVNAVAPGFVDTEWQKTKPAEVRKSIESKISVDRFAAPDEIAEVFLMLIDNKYFNGEIVVVDGGYLYK